VKIASRSKQLLLGAAALLIGLSAACAQPAWRWTGASKVVVVPDVHGAYTELVALLKATNLLDADLKWSGGDATLVSLGDLLDRGPRSRDVLELMMRLQTEAAAHGGAVHVLLGNHELMNLIGDLRYVTPADYQAFAADAQPAERDAAYREFLRGPRAPAASADARAAFDRLYPPGYFAREEAFRADGRYGHWLVSLPALIVIDDTAFVHGGLPKLVATAGGEALDRNVHDELVRYLALRDRLADSGLLPRFDRTHDIERARAARQALGERPPADKRDAAALLDEFLTLGDAPALGADGPLWYRGSVYCNPFLEEPVLRSALERLDAKRVIVGHTPTEDRRPRELYDGRLVMLDTGMLAQYFDGRPAALILDASGTFVQALSPEERVPLPRGRLEAYGLTEAEVLDALSTGTLEPSASREASRASVSLEYHGKRVAARFYPSGADHAAAHELAAYGLDRLLGLHLVPPTVAREVDGRAGALELAYPGAVSEQERVEQRAPLEPWCPIPPQAELMLAFDALTENVGRTRENILYRRESSVMKLIDFGRAFGPERSVRLRPGTLTLSPAMRHALSSLDSQTLQSAIGQWVGSRSIRALLERRDSLLEAPPARSVENAN
jgi:hypothetical protein